MNNLSERLLINPIWTQFPSKKFNKIKIWIYLLYNMIWYFLISEKEYDVFKNDHKKYIYDFNRH